MATILKKLYNTNGRAVVRTVTAIDAATWDPDDASTPNDEILDARAWEKLQIRPEFDVAPGGTGTISVQLLKAVPTASGREWIEESAVAIPVGESADFTVDGHLISFRVTALTLGTASSVSIVATGGMWLRPKL